MKNHIIIRIELTQEKLRTQKKIDELVTKLEKNILPNLMYQTSQDYMCFIEYPKRVEERIKVIMRNMESVKNINFIKEDGRKYLIDVWRDRVYLNKIEEYIKGLSIAPEDTIMMVYWAADVVYDYNLVKYLGEYKVQHKEKLIRFARDKNPLNFGGFIYRCTPREYDMYFKAYDLIKGFKLSEFQAFPTRYIEELNYFRTQ